MHGKCSRIKPLYYSPKASSVFNYMNGLQLKYVASMCEVRTHVMELSKLMDACSWRRHTAVKNVAVVHPNVSPKQPHAVTSNILPRSHHPKLSLLFFYSCNSPMCLHLTVRTLLIQTDASPEIIQYRIGLFPCGYFGFSQVRWPLDSRCLDHSAAAMV